MSREHYDYILNNVQFQELVRQRSKLSWTLAALILLVYYSFILVIAFAPDMLGIPIRANATMTWGIVMGLGVILFTFIITGIYVHQANTVYDRLLRDVIDAAEIHVNNPDDQRGTK